MQQNAQLNSILPAVQYQLNMVSQQLAQQQWGGGGGPQKQQWGNQGNTNNGHKNNKNGWNGGSNDGNDNGWINGGNGNVNGGGGNLNDTCPPNEHVYKSDWYCCSHSCATRYNSNQCKHCKQGRQVKAMLKITMGKKSNT